jgi:hypothetical protein
MWKRMPDGAQEWDGICPWNVHTKALSLSVTSPLLQDFKTHSLSNIKMHTRCILDTSK